MLLERNEYIDEYYGWIKHLAIADDSMRKKYSTLLNALNSETFTYTMSQDENRYIDGLDMRYRFGYEHGYSSDFIRNYIDLMPCSILEMMVALAFRIEEHIMTDSSYGDRTSEWFLNMLDSLGLAFMDNELFDSEYFEQRIHIFLNRQYSYNGSGGLFTVNNPRQDMTEVEIWYQCMWYLESISDIRLIGGN